MFFMLKSKVVRENGLGGKLLKDAKADKSEVIEVFAILDPIFEKWANEPTKQDNPGDLKRQFSKFR